MKKHGFTLIEMLFVIVIISLLVSVGSNLFKNSDKNLINAQSCMNYTYGFISNTINSALTYKGVYSGTNLLFPDSYYITLNKQRLSVGYSGGTAGNKVTTNVYFTGTNGASPYQCYGRDYYVQLTGFVGNLNVNINLLQDNYNPLPRFLINNNQGLFTGSFDTNFCGNEIDGNNKKFCRPLGRFLIDRRSETVRYVRCLSWKNGGKECNNWSDSNLN